jgi:hypothetical protein
VLIEQEAWLGEIRHSLTEGRVVRALRVSGRPPEPGVRFPAELAEELSRAAGEAMTPDTTPDRWVALLDAVVSSPVRRTVTPQGLPSERGEDLERALRLAAPRVPALGALLGGTGPPGARRPLPPRPDSRRADPRRPPRPAPPAAPPPSADDAPAAAAPAAPEPARAPVDLPASAAPEGVPAAPTADPAPPPEAPAQDPAAAAASGDDGDDAVLVEELG